MRFRSDRKRYQPVWQVVLCVLAMIVGSGALLAQLREYDCGNENEQTCRVGQWERYNMRYWTENRCEFDLKPVDGVCINEKRRLLKPTGGWLGWAMQEQRYRISQDEPINHVTWLGSHNVFANTNQGFNSPLYTNHVYSITDQLNWGVRHLELDPHYYGFGPPLRSNANRLCHAGNTLACLVPGYGQRLLGFALREINTWLAANPNEVVVVKLNDKNAAGSVMRAEIQQVLGSRLVTPPVNFQRWPTMREIRATGRQILFMQHDEPAGINPVTWNAKDLVLENNWPIKQDFARCLDSDGRGPLERGKNNWWDVAEGRSRMNVRAELLGLSIFDSLTGSLEAPQVRAATNCGVAIIGLDFIESMWSVYNVYPLKEFFDTRHAAHIWSWRQNDFGGNASFDPSDRRWVSRPAADRLPLVCSPVRAPGTPDQERKWRITAQPHAWSRVNGDNICQSEFGSAAEPYHFAFPANALQNRLLGEYLDSLGVNTPVWIGYTTGPQDFLTVQPGDLTLTMPSGGPVPPPQELDILGPRGARFGIKSNQSWLSAFSGTRFLPADGSTLTQAMTITNDAASLAPGTYAATLEVILPADGVRPEVIRRVDVKLRVLEPTTTTISGQTSVPFGTEPQIRASVVAASGRAARGTMEIVRISQGLNEPVIQEVSAGLDRKVSAENLPPGVHQFFASYLGNDEFQPSESQPFTLTVTARIGLTPSVATFDYTKGSPLPAAQQVQVTNLASAAAVTPLGDCPWLTASLGGIAGSSASVLLQPQPALATLQASDFACRFEVTDALSNGMDASVIDVSLRVRATLQATPATLPQLLVGSVPANTQVLISTPTGDAIPLRTSSTCTEVALVAEQKVTVANASVVALRGSRPPGLYTCQITVESDLAAQPLVLPVSLRLVNPTIVDTNPPGLSYLVDGLPFTGRNEFTWEPGTQRQISTTFEQAGGPGTRHRFQNWSSGPSQTQTINAVANGASYTANFSTEHLLTRTVSPAASGTVNATPFSADGFYPAGTQVQLTATPASGFQATGFSGAGLVSSTNTQATVAMSAARNITANFAASNLVPITIETNAPSATVTVDGQPQPLPITLLLEQGRQYRFVAPGFVEENPASVWVFSQWVGAMGSNVVDYVVTSEPATLQINYRRQVLYSFSATPPEGGSVTFNGWQLATGQLPIEAIPAPGFRFVRWLGDLAGQPNPVTLPVDRPLTATAEFAPLAQPVLVVTTGAARTDGTAPGTRRVPLRLMNRGTGAAAAARITSVSNVSVMAGSGVITNATTLPLTLGAIAPGGSANFELLFEWPATATRVQFTVNFDAGDGAAPGSTTLTLFR